MNFTYAVLIVIVTLFPLAIWLPYIWNYSLAYVGYFLTSFPASHDYIVVGSGSAGSVVAGRLAEAGHSVLLVEAGGPSPAVAHIPSFVGLLQRSVIDWQYKTEPQRYSHFGYNGNVSSWPRGKVLGGSSILNYMLYMRGHSKDYDEWRDMGLEGWGWDDVLPYFKKSENMSSDIENREKFHGTDGPLGVTKDNYKEPIIDFLMEGAKELGYKVGDINGELQDEGFTPSQVSISNGWRAGTFEAFARKYSDERITVLTFAHVNKLILKGKEAVGVEVSRFGRIEQFYAKQEVIVSAGAIGSPQILMLSGIGDQEHLQEVGVTPVHHLPQVGQNLQDHLILFVAFDTPNPLSFDALAPIYPDTWDQYNNGEGEGPLSSTGGCAGLAHVHSGINTDKSRPDVQFHLLGLTVATDYGLILKENLGVDEKFWRWFSKHTGNFSSGIVPTLSRPRSRGYIKLRSSDPNDYPIIQPNYLSEQHDVDTMVAGVQKAIELLETNTMKEIGASLYEADPYCEHLKFKSKEYWECYVRHYAATVYHHVGTCSMGTVLDNRMRVNGMKRLRVVDGSSMPKLVGGNTNAPIIMMAEKAADMIRMDYREDRNLNNNANFESKIEL